MNAGTSRHVRNAVLAQRIRAKLVERLHSREDLSPLIQYNTAVSNIPQSELEQRYLPDIDPVERCIGEDLSASRFVGVLHQTGVVNHLELTLYVALRAIECLNAHKAWWTAWSGTPGESPSVQYTESLDNRWRIDWLRTLFRCVLCMPIGYMVSHTALRGGSRIESRLLAPSWSPTCEDLDQYMDRHGPISVHRSSAVIAPRAISFSTYLRLFDRSPKDVPMLSTAEADFFSDVPCDSNPLWRAFNNAMRHVFYDRFYLNLPYWWVLTLNHHFVRDEGYTPIDCIVTEGVGLRWAAEHSGREAPQPGHNEEPTELTPAPPEDSGAGLLSDRACDDDEHDRLADRALKPLVASCVRTLREDLRSGSITVNGSGAPMQKVGGRVYLVVPLFWRMLCERLNRADADADTIDAAFAESGLVECPPEIAFEIRPPHRKRRIGKVRARALSDRGEALLFPQAVDIPDNPDLRPLSP